MRRVCLTIVAMLALSLTGCSGVEAEKRVYPQVLGIDYGESGYKVVLGLPDMSKATGQDKSTEGQTDSSLVFQGSNQEEIMRKYNRTQEKYLDLGHVQVIILGETLIERENWEQVLTAFKENTYLGEDIYILCTEDIDEIMEQNGGSKGSLGDFLVGVYENRPTGKSLSGVTLRQVYKTWYEKGELLEIPKVAVSDQGSILVG